MRSSTASLRLHVESALAGRVASPFRLREAAAPLVVPTPGCLLGGSAHSAEIVRSVLSYKKPRFIDQPAPVGNPLEAMVHFQMKADPYDTQALPHTTLLPQQEERMQDPG